MPLLSSADRRFAQAVSDLVYCNPFLSERIAYERAALGATFDARQPVWNIHPELEGHNPNLQLLCERAVSIADAVREKMTAGRTASEEELTLYEDLVLFAQYHRFAPELDRLIQESAEGKVRNGPVRVYQAFLREAGTYLELPGVTLPTGYPLPHLFAAFFQIRRAFHNIFNFILGMSGPAIELRAAVWQSIFTHDMRRYFRILYDRMSDITTLITGPSGTGKELVARAVGLSRYIPIDAKQMRFTEDFAGSFYPLNLSALSPTLIESELFGHARGAFTGAVGDRAGWLEECSERGTVFLDEIGELDPSIQVKLLRVLQTRRFARLGETRERAFRGKVIAATNQDLAEQMRDGAFREDLYYRLCSDIIVTPSLRQRLNAAPEELGQLTRSLAARLIGDEAPQLAAEVQAWIEEHLPEDYPWPGNVRELEQCVRNVLIRKSYLPTPREPKAHAGDPYAETAEAMRNTELTVDELLHCYCTMAYAQAGSYEEAARRLGLDRRTVKAKVDQAMLERLKGRP